MEFTFLVVLIIIIYALLAAFVDSLTDRILLYLNADDFTTEVVKTALVIISFVTQFFLLITVVCTIGSLIKKYYGH